ncbi:hypothetical protein [Thauera butanivorans]|uniref:hypothetical protein n=1 Tax=Thauera butanivorans TaxID=86174 RepID=UPI00083981CA|nr:hypothetical protein [Thauera butanivorans]
MSLHHTGLLIIFVLLHGNAIAAPVVSGEIITAGSSGDCALLQTGITLHLSHQVKGAYLCGTAAIGLSTCHPGGKRTLTLNDGSSSSTGVVFQALTGGGKITQAADCPPGNEQIPDSLVRSDTP